MDLTLFNIYVIDNSPSNLKQIFILGFDDDDDDDTVIGTLQIHGRI